MADLPPWLSPRLAKQMSSVFAATSSRALFPRTSLTPCPCVSVLIRTRVHRRPGVDRNPRVHLLHTPGPHPLLEHLPPVDGNDTFVIVNAPPPGAPPPPAQPEAPEAPPEGGADGDGGAEAGGLGLGGAQQEDGGSAWLNHPLAQAVRG